MRTLTLAGLQSILAEQTSHVWVFGVEVHLPDGSVERYVANTVNVNYGGNIYTALPMEVTLAQDSEDAVPQVQLRIDNINRIMSTAVRNNNTALTFVLQLFRIAPGEYVGSDPLAHREVEATYSLLSAQVNDYSVTATLGYRNDFLNEPALHTRFTPAICPALFK